jgi:hypothetical protein
MLKPQEDPPIIGRVDGRYAGIGFRNRRLRRLRRFEEGSRKSDFDLPFSVS